MSCALDVRPSVVHVACHSVVSDLHVVPNVPMSVVSDLKAPNGNRIPVTIKLMAMRNPTRHTIRICNPLSIPQ